MPFFCLLAVFVLLPFPDGAVRADTWIYAMVAVGALMSWWSVAFLLGTADVTPAARAAALPVACLVLLMLWQLAGAMFWSLDAHRSFYDVCRTSMYLAVFWLVLSLTDSRRKLLLLMWTLLCAGTLQATLALVVDRNVVYANYNHLAGYLEMTLAIGIGLMLSQLDDNRRTSWRETLRRLLRALLGPKARVRLMLVVMVIALILTRSRMGNTAFFLSLGLAGGLGLLMFRNTSRSMVTFFVSMILVDVLLLGTFFGLDQLQERFEQIEASRDARVKVTALTVSAVKDNWLMGTGGGTFYTVFPQYRDQDVHAYFLRADNDFVEFWLEFGVVGLLLMAAVVVQAFWWSIRAQRERRSTFMKSVGFSATMAILSIMIHSSSDFNLHITANAATFMMILALPFIALTLDRRSSKTL